VSHFQIPILPSDRIPNYPPMLLVREKNASLYAISISRLTLIQSSAEVTRGATRCASCGRRHVGCPHAHIPLRFLISPPRRPVGSAPQHGGCAAVRLVERAGSHDSTGRVCLLGRGRRSLARERQEIMLPAGADDPSDPIPGLLAAIPVKSSPRQ
jgi:hypothetical protein